MIVTSDPVSPIRPVGSDVTLTCTVELSPAVDVPVTVNTVWTGPDGFMTTNTAQPVRGNPTTYTSTAMVSSFERDQSGNYTCTATVISTFQFISGSELQPGTARITISKMWPSKCIILHVLYCIGVYLSLNGVVYANNSLIAITEIGETDSSTSPPQNNGVQCITGRMPCCTGPNFRLGDWLFPDGGVVPSRSSATSFYRNRGTDGSVNLNHFNSNTTHPTGLFCCVVPDATDVNQTLCINISKLCTTVTIHLSQQLSLYICCHSRE